jgi:hypothetical protein
VSKRRSKDRIKLVPPLGSTAGVPELLAEALARAQNDETLAVALVEVRHAGEIETWIAGHDGFKHALLAGATLLTNQIINCHDEE